MYVYVFLINCNINAVLVEFALMSPGCVCVVGDIFFASWLLNRLLSKFTVPKPCIKTNFLFPRVYMTLADFDYPVEGLWFSCSQSLLYNISLKYNGCEKNASCALNLISTFVSLGRCICWWTISPRWYHLPSSQCFGIDMVYYIYISSKFIAPV